MKRPLRWADLRLAGKSILKTALLTAATNRLCQVSLLIFCLPAACSIFAPVFSRFSLLHVGSMINDGQPDFIAAPHLVFAPGVARVLRTLAFNLISQGIQGVLDPKRPVPKGETEGNNGN